MLLEVKTTYFVFNLQFKAYKSDFLNVTHVRGGGWYVQKKIDVIEWPVSAL